MNVTDRRTDRRTDGHRVTAYTALMHTHRAAKINGGVQCRWCFTNYRSI